MRLTAQCYCGAVQIVARADPITVAYCHCASCRRHSGAPVSAFAAFAESDVTMTPEEGPTAGTAPGVSRGFCAKCGSPTLARYDYLPGQVYVPVGLFEDPNAIAPESHSHTGEQVTWLCLADDLPRDNASGRARLRGAGTL
ncbi:MAG: GFA family protein [Pseudomonadota bacterium]